MTRSSEGGDKTHPYVECVLQISYYQRFVEKLGVLLELWTSLTNYEHIGPRGISSALFFQHTNTSLVGTFQWQ